MAASVTPVDMELKKAFQELQTKVLETTQKLKLADVQIDSLKKVRQYTSITCREITDYQENTRMYKQVGRLFILESKSNILNILQAKDSKMESKIQELVSNKQYLERNVKESKENLRELVATKQRER